MQQALELALDRAEYVIESARQRPPKRKYLSSGRKSVFQKLYDLYIEECEKEPEVKKLRRNVNLLEKLVMQETLSCLVVNLYPGNEGYSLMLRGKNGSDSETIRLPYEEGELLEYLDAEELPPILVDLLEKSQVNIFHCGCVIAEIRDYRQSSNMKSPGYQSRHILLRPTMQTLICDVHSITSDNHKWTQEDKLLLESQLILATAEPLCLDPSIAVTCTANRLLYNKQKMNTRPMKRCFKRYSRSSLNRQQDLSHCPPPPQLRLLDFLQKRKERKAGQHYDLKISKAGNCVDMWKRSPCNLAIPSEVDVEKYAKVEKSIKSDDSQPTVWPAHDVKDDYVFECEAGTQYQKTKLTILQSLGDPLYYGKIQPCKADEESDSQMSPSHSSTDDHSNWFIIGSKTDAERVVNQYQELVQNEAKCPVKMSHSSSGSASLSQVSPGKETDQTETVSVQSSVLGKGVKHRPPPIKLPSSSGNSSSGNYFTPQQTSSFLKSPTPPPSSKPSSIPRKSSVDLNQVSMLSPAALSPASSSQRSGTPKPSTPTPTPSSTPHPPDAQSSTPSTPSATPTPQDSGFTPQPTLLTQFAQQQRSLSQAMPVTTIPLSTMVTSITPGTTATQVMANSAGLNFINVVGSVCGAQALMSGSNPMLGCNTGAITPAGINLSGLLPSGGLLPNALPSAMQAASQAGVPFGLKNTSSLRPLNLLQLPGGSLIFNTLQQQQQQLSQFTPQQPQQPTTCSPQQPGEQGSEQGSTSQEQALSAQQAAVINLTGVGSFMQSQAAAVAILAASNGYGSSSSTNSSATSSSAYRQPVKK
ncbi:SUPT20H isoform 5 [Pan troglodytes]|uniref:SPT20 homolog, SAGA complex component n=3 Tax=Homininae TaxID=207598 RepID=A0A2I3S377_PANTR|nr:transcription factor SPT20 homolog isoform c [Homo sapiens]XP_009425168.1 transcription factor SPT20 homolog isoform X10 [Pan troglodytes]XP_047286405.1 transcription factor SPT20 homolog isoform X10 [Homo sapiens]XP_054230667.1 transcription factor SPT20 homolog isoform X10 [Homo sapiens]XP_054521169.1 transcription factor SPT20 homolog isoform X10 [Pan troglodytes]7KTR_C Chain C, Isoform 3 of Transcription factor SPT20 homolog [Homo sapiens]7KTS_C Chain C, Isoform 3 of Transcription fact|eukprot:NP_001265409.1 transcription factor SPT20 homolog isoform c [Homo sapiens]